MNEKWKGFRMFGLIFKGFWCMKLEVKDRDNKVENIFKEIMF